MHEIEINNKSYELKYGLKALKQLDSKYKTVVDGIEVGMSMQAVVISLKLYNPTILVDVIQAGLSHHKIKPTISDIENYIEEQEDIKALCDSFLNILSESKITGPMVTSIIDEINREVNNN